MPLRCKKMCPVISHLPLHNIVGWNMNPDLSYMENRDIPASYIGLLEGKSLGDMIQFDGFVTDIKSRVMSPQGYPFILRPLVFSRSNIVWRNS